VSRSFQDLIEEIRETANIVEVVSAYIPVKRAGRSYKALCPFHPDKNPSLMINEEKGMWHCFGCGAGGDVFSFVMRMENLDFREAAQLVAERLGISFQWDRRESERGKLIEICETCAKYWQDVLLNRPEGERGREYLRKRGLKQETIEEFRLGFAPPDIRELLGLLRKGEFTPEDLGKSGAFSRREDGLHLIFGGRVIFPIFSPEGKVVAFGGRAIDDSVPKYINSSETLIFKKGNVLYGFHMAKESITKRKQVIIVEGYMDAITLYEAGIKNVVATLGTALTEGHLRLIRRYIEEIILAFDPDSPGMNAALRATPLIEESHLSAKVMLLPEGSDPDSFVRKEGREAFEALLDKAVDIYDFQIKKALEKGEEGKREAIEIISKIEEPGRRNEKSKMLAEELGEGKPEVVKEYADWIAAEVKRRRVGGKRRITTPSPAGQTGVYPAEEKAERELIRSLLSQPSFIPLVSGFIEEDSFSTPLLKAIYAKMKSLGEGFSRQALLDLLDEEEKSKVSELELAEMPPPSEQVIYDCVLRMTKLYLRRSGQINERVLKLLIEGQFAQKKSLSSLSSLLNEIYKLL